MSGSPSLSKSPASPPLLASGLPALGGPAAARGAEPAGDARPGGHVLEGAVAPVPVEPIGQRLIAAGPAVVERARGPEAADVVLDAVPQVVADVEGGPAGPVETTQ